MSQPYFENPSFLYLLLLIPLLILWYKTNKKGSKAAMNISSLKNFRGIKNSFKVYLRHGLFVLRLLAITLLIFALARPVKNPKPEGIDIIISLDISLSMLAQDLTPNRLDASKKVAMDFIDNRPNDRIGLVIFSGESFTQCPLTTDHEVLKNLFRLVKPGMVEHGTAIGMGIATAVNRLKDSKAKSKVIILLTDGVNNAGSVDPELAAELAQSFGIKIYAIGVGTRGMAYSPVGISPSGNYYFDYIPVDLDDITLNKVAKMTKGKYFRATDTERLQEIYSEIDRMEKTVLDEAQRRKKIELFLPFAIAAGLILLSEFLLKNTLLRSLT